MHAFFVQAVVPGEATSTTWQQLPGILYLLVTGSLWSIAEMQHVPSCMDAAAMRKISMSSTMLFLALQ